MTRSWAGVLVGRWVRVGVMVGWLVVVAVAAPLAGKLPSVEKNDAKSWLPSSAESTRSLDRQAVFASPNTIPAVVVYERSTGLTEADRRKVAADAKRFGEFADLGGPVVGPIPATDAQAAQITVPLDLGTNGWSRASSVVTSMKQVATAGADGLVVRVTGPAGIAADSSKAFEGIDSTLLFGTVAVVVLILLLTYRSPILWLIPVISAGAALTTAQAVIYLFAVHAGLTVNAQSAGILTVLVFGAGTDYALLLIARYREELRRHEDRQVAMAVALHRAGPAIIASAATVVLSMLCLLAAETNSTKGLGPVAAIGILVGLAVMLSLLPTLLVALGRWVFWPVRPNYGSTDTTATGVWSRVGNVIAARPRLTWVATAAALAVVALGSLQLNASGLTNKESFRGSPDSVVGEEMLARHFAAGAGTPLVVVSRAEQSAAVRTAFAATTGVDGASVTTPVIKDGYAYLQGTLLNPPDSPPAFDTVDRARRNVHAVAGADALVGGYTATNLDVQRAARRDRNVIIPVVLAVVFAILALLLRAIVAPVLLVATVVLSYAAALGVSALVFKHGFGFGGADSSFPLFVFVFLVALGIDYNIFLMTRVREEAQRLGTRRAALVALAATGGVITSAGFVLAGTFAVLATLPLTAFAEIGFTVAFGVLLDTIVVRSILVTALNLDIGRFVWWPSHLARHR